MALPSLHVLTDNAKLTDKGCGSYSVALIMLPTETGAVLITHSQALCDCTVTPSSGPYGLKGRTRRVDRSVPKVCLEVLVHPKSDINERLLGPLQPLVWI